MSVNKPGRIALPLLLALCALLLSACGKTAPPEPSPMQAGEETVLKETSRPNLLLFVGESEIPVIWEDNASVDALRDLVPPEGLRLQLSLYGGFEQQGELGAALVSEDVKTRAMPGDIMLYAGSRIVLFYGTNEWSYTRLGKIDLDQAALKELLAYGDVAVTFTLAS